MTDQLPWTDDQWDALQRVAHDGARRARVASSFLPLVGPLPDSQTTVPAQHLHDEQLLDRQRGEAGERLDVFDSETLPLTTLAVELYLKAPEVADPDLAVAKQMVGRAAEVLGRLEDAIVFNGQPGHGEAPVGPGGDVVVEPPIYRVRGGETRPGLLDAGEPPLSYDAGGGNLVGAMAQAVSSLEGYGHYGPFAAVLGHEVFTDATDPSDSLVLPIDRILPFLDGPLRRSSVLPPDRAVVVALGGGPIDLVVARDIHVSFLQVTLEPRWVLRVSERFVLRIKQDRAVLTLVRARAGGSRGASRAARTGTK